MISSNKFFYVILAIFSLCGKAVAEPVEVVAQRGGGLCFNGCTLEIQAVTEDGVKCKTDIVWEGYDGKTFTINNEENRLFDGNADWRISGKNTLKGTISAYCRQSTSLNSLAFKLWIPEQCSVNDSEKTKLMISFPDKEDFILNIGDEAKYSISGKAKKLLLFGKFKEKHFYKSGNTYRFEVELYFPENLTFVPLERYTITQNNLWQKLYVRRDIKEGSALDFSGMGFQDAPAGKYGWLKSVGGHFEFENLPGKEQRFYGVNLCSSANYPTHEVADALVERFVRLGYNSIRIHHHDGSWRNPEKQEKLDYLLAKAYENGLYVTTDLYVSRKVEWKDLGVEKSGMAQMAQIKEQFLKTDAGYLNWCEFAREFMEHVNPYTGRKMKDEPGMPLICLINEGSMIPKTPELTQDQRGALLDSLQGIFFQKGSKFLREMGCRALLTNDNNGPRKHLDRGIAWMYDYVDNHFYIDHPKFPAKGWSLPASRQQRNVILYGGPWGFRQGFTDNDAKPFVITEWNYAGPGMYRSMGGLIFASLASVQKWDGLWRFAYSHNVENLVDNNNWHMTYFDINTDPIQLASERMAVCLFLRRDASKPDEFKMDQNEGTAKIVSPRTCGFFAFEGTEEAGPLRVDLKSSPATIWVSSLNNRDIEDSGRILLVHATDAEGDGTEYMSSKRELLMKWGTGALIRKGEADIRLKLNSPDEYDVYELETDGSRAKRLKIKVQDGALCFSISTVGPYGARLYYEIVRK